MYVDLNIGEACELVIGASLSEPHTSESNGAFLYIIIIITIIYLSYVFHMSV